MKQIKLMVKEIFNSALNYFFDILNLNEYVMSIYFIIQVLVCLCVIFFGMLGVVLNRQNLLLILLSFELMTLGFILGYLSFSALIDDFRGVVFSIVILGLVAAESCVALAIFVHYYKILGLLNLDSKATQSRFG